MTKATGQREAVAVFARGTPEATVVDVAGRRLLVTALWPTPRLVIVGDGLIADALDAAGRLHAVPADAIGRIRCPAGLDIGARTPAEIAVAIVAEMVAVQAGATGSPLAERDGPIHHDGLHAPPARHPAGPRPT